MIIGKIFKQAMCLFMLVGLLIPFAEKGANAESVLPFSSIILPGQEVAEFKISGTERAGVCLFDYDRDNDLDIFIPAGENALFRNDGNLIFTHVAELAGVTDNTRMGVGCGAADIDNDGDLDLYVTNGTTIRDDLDGALLPDDGRNTLFLNNGDGTFTDITSTSGLGGTRNSNGPTFMDVNSDGWIDVFVANFIDRDFYDAPTNGSRNSLYLNNGDNTFTDISDSAGIAGDLIDRPFDPEVPGEAYHNTHIGAWIDFDDDGDMDIITGEDFGRLGYFKNNFIETGSVVFDPAVELQPFGAFMGLALGDYDGDADIDIFAANAGSQFALSGGLKSETENLFHALMRNDGLGLFSNTSADIIVQHSQFPNYQPLYVQMNGAGTLPVGTEVLTGLEAYDFGFGTTFFDYDNDGDADLYWIGALGHGRPPDGVVMGTPGRLMMNDGLGNFTDVTLEAQVADLQDPDYANPDTILFYDYLNGKAVAHGDLNNDGYADLVVTNSGIANAVSGSSMVRVFINGGGTQNWLKIRLGGRSSNRDGIGAKVFVTAEISLGGGLVTQVQQLGGGTYLGQDSLDLVFGMGSALRIKEVKVVWPSGTVQIVTNSGRGIKTNQYINVIEGKAIKIIQ